jgi:hypothetical protein
MKVILTDEAKWQLMALSEDPRFLDAAAFIGSYIRGLHDERYGSFTLRDYTRAGFIKFLKTDAEGDHYILSPSNEIQAHYVRTGNTRSIRLVFYKFIW